VAADAGRLTAGFATLFPKLHGSFSQRSARFRVVRLAPSVENVSNPHLFNN